MVTARAPADHDGIRDEIERRLRDRLGVKIRAEVVAPGALDEWTGIDVSPKLNRFRDERGR